MNVFDFFNSKLALSIIDFELFVDSFLTIEWLAIDGRYPTDEAQDVLCKQSPIRLRAQIDNVLLRRARAPSLIAAFLSPYVDL